MAPNLPVAPTRLIVLQHGLYGSASNLLVLKQNLEQLGGDSVVVHSATSNEGSRTRDGVEAGGRRLAEEVLLVRGKYPSLESLALVGNSLGGLYVRYASTLLLDPSGDTIAGGLRPETLLTFCSPHLGVRTFTYLPLPAPHKSWIGWPSWWVAGTTGDDLLLRTPLLETMSCPQSSHYRALGAFQRRRAYANLKGDFMVPFGTAAFETAAASAATWTFGFRDSHLAHNFARAPGVRFVDESVLSGSRDGIAVVKEDSPAGLDVRLSQVVAETREGRMAASINALGWSKVGVIFRSAGRLSPLAHNRLPALRRDGWRRGIDALEQVHQGRPVMLHAAQYLLGLDSEEALLEALPGQSRLQEPPPAMIEPLPLPS